MEGGRIRGFKVRIPISEKIHPDPKHCLEPVQLGPALPRLQESPG